MEFNFQRLIVTSLPGSAQHWAGQASKEANTLRSALYAGDLGHGKVHKAGIGMAGWEVLYSETLKPRTRSGPVVFERRLLTIGATQHWTMSKLFWNQKSGLESSIPNSKVGLTYRICCKDPITVFPLHSELIYLEQIKLRLQLSIQVPPERDKLDQSKQVFSSYLLSN